MKVSRPQKHRWQPTQYTHCYNIPYARKSTLLETFKADKKALDRFAHAILTVLEKRNHG